MVSPKTNQMRETLAKNAMIIFCRSLKFYFALLVVPASITSMFNVILVPLIYNILLSLQNIIVSFDLIFI